MYCFITPPLGRIRNILTVYEGHNGILAVSIYRRLRVFCHSVSYLVDPSDVNANATRFLVKKFCRRLYYTEDASNTQ